MSIKEEIKHFVNEDKTAWEQALEEIGENTDKSRKDLLFQKYGVAAPVLTDEEEDQCKN